MNKFINRYYLGLLTSVFAVFLAGCASNTGESNPGEVNQKPAATTSSVTAPANLQGTALAFDINKTELISGPEQGLQQDGTLKNYFFAKHVFSDGRDYNGSSWGSEYQYTTRGNQAEIMQLIKIPTKDATIEVTVKTQLTYLTTTTGTFEIDVTQTHSLAGTVHFKHGGNFHPIDNNLEMMAKGLNHSNMDFVFQNISANENKIDIKPGAKITMVFSDPHVAKFTLNGKEYQSTDYQLIPVDTFNKRIQGTFTDGAPFDIKLHFNEFYTGQFEVNVGNNSFTANGTFTSSRWIPVADYKIEGTFTDGLKYASKYTKIEYPYSVYLPPNYKNSGKKYPVLYLTDGQWVKEFHKAVEAHHKEFIVVAIEQGQEDRRATDYQLPGAKNYIRFLKEEIIPHIEKQYRTNNNRLFWGASLGGTLGEILLSQETSATPYFRTYGLSDGAFWANSPEIQQKVKASLAQQKAEKISIFTSGTRQGNYMPNLNFVKRLQALNNSSLDIRNIELKETHNEMATPTFEHYIDSMQ
ncbi:alpha/beta hydrolase [Cellvibrio sp.]|uniref:alpha/beta hydrolase n=1 Tax=Cellvibrio sp. TaxID=1965322 RepID=UPI0039648193